MAVASLVSQGTGNGSIVRDGREAPAPSDRARRGLHVQMLGPLTISRDGVTLTLPASRKVRALFAYLALAPRPIGRTRLCELLWDVPNDPRGELRWCLSKIRSLVDEHSCRRVQTCGDAVTLDLSGCFVDVVEVDRATQAGIETLGPDRLRALFALFVGDFLDGLQIDRSPYFHGWLVAQRRRFRACHVAVLEHLVRSLPAGSDEIFDYLEQWLELAPFDQRAHMTLLSALVQRGRIGEGEEHLTATVRLFEAEELDWTCIRDTWRAARGLQASSSLSEAEARSAWPVSTVSPAEIGRVAARRASIAVMPFFDRTLGNGDRGGLADGLVRDVITRLAKLRSLFVIAPGTMFALGERSIGPEEAGRMLNVDYVACGAVRRLRDRITVTIDLAETRTARVIWAEAFDHKLDDAFLVLDEIGNRIVASIASEIETVERNRAILKPPSSLDAWEAYHRGLWHMYRFTRPDNDLAQHFFQMAVRLDPAFARAYAGLSFTHFQNVFQGWAARGPEIDRAFETAGQSIIVDDRDPGAHWAMGRALWLRGRQDQSLVELETAVDLSPNFALGHYTLAFVHSQSGDPRAAIESSDHSRHLSPFDPLMFGMLGVRAMALVRLGRFEEAADWSIKAAARPNAHVHILAIAAHCLAVAGRLEEARAFVALIHKIQPRYRVDDFLKAFHFTSDAAALFRKAAKRIGIG
jgi:DNA-binding SARP family transcriptional activator/TolB-like protein